MKHLFVPYEIALKLKEKGFDESCLGWYWNNGKELSFGLVNASELTASAIVAPLYQQVIDWFREKHKIHLRIDIVNNNLAYSPFLFQEKSSMDWTSVWKGEYYEAVNKAIEEAIKLI